MKKFFFFTAALFAAVSFAACSDDDENVGDRGETPTYYVSRIERSFYDSSRIYSHDFDYDEQNRLIRFDKAMFNYVDNKVFCQGSYYDADFSYILNDKGYATQTIDGKYKFEYDNDGYLLQEKSDDNYFSFVISYTWENGDMIKDRYDSKDAKSTATFTYYDYVNNQNLGIYEIFNDVEDLYRIFLGRRNKHLLKSAKWENSDGESFEATYEYELDSKGRPVTIYEESSYHGDHGGSTNRSIYKLSYK